MKPHCHTASGSTSQDAASRSARARTRRAVSPASSGWLYSRIGTPRSWAGSERTPSGSTNLNRPAPAARVFQPWASPCTSTARPGSNAAARSTQYANARSITSRGHG